MRAFGSVSTDLSYLLLFSRYKGPKGAKNAYFDSSLNVYFLSDLNYFFTYYTSMKDAKQMYHGSHVTKMFSLSTMGRM